MSIETEQLDSAAIVAAQAANHAYSLLLSAKIDPSNAFSVSLLRAEYERLRADADDALAAKLRADADTEAKREEAEDYAQALAYHTEHQLINWR